VQVGSKGLGQRILAAVKPDEAVSSSPATAEPRAADPGTLSAAVSAPATAPAELSDRASGPVVSIPGIESLQEELIKTADKLLRELDGMPIPNAPGQILPLGSTRCAFIP